MKILGSILCEDIIRDAESDKVSLLNIFDGLNAIGLPFFLQKLALFISIDKDEQKGTSIEAILEIKNNERLIFNEKIIVGVDEKARARLLIKLNGIMIYEAGVLIVNLISDGVVMPLCEISVVVTKPAAPPTEETVQIEDSKKTS
jgi:hypothetical protein